MGAMPSGPRRVQQGQNKTNSSSWIAIYRQKKATHLCTELFLAVLDYHCGGRPFQRIPLLTSAALDQQRPEVTKTTTLHDWLATPETLIC